VSLLVQDRRRFRFGPFEADLETGELQKNDRKIPLQEKPFQVLIALLEQRGKLVSREVLRQRLWAAESFGDFDNGLNTAVSKLREALGDSAQKGRYIETLARRGYRFVSSVEELGSPVEAQRKELDIVEKHVAPDIVVVQIGGKITIGPECQQIEWLIAHLLAENERKIIFDISNVTRLDSTGVGIIVVSFGKLTKAGGDMRVAGAQGIVKELLKVARVDHILPLYPTVAAAAEGFSGGAAKDSQNP
jgi:anti-anti-sigma factor